MLPEGYKLYTSGTGYIILAVTNFLEMTRDAPEFVDYNGHKWKRDVIEVIPPRLIGHACSMRRYVAC